MPRGGGVQTGATFRPRPRESTLPFGKQSVSGRVLLPGCVDTCDTTAIFRACVEYAGAKLPGAGVALRSWSQTVWVGIAVVALALGLGGHATAATDPNIARLAGYAANGTLDPEVFDALANGRSAEAFIVLQPSVAPPRDRHRFATSKAEALQPTNGGVTVVRDYDQLPTQLVRIPSPGIALLILRNERLVGGVRANRTRTADLAQSTVLINQPQAAAAGYTGAGYSVAVLDTGLDYTRAAFGTCPNPLPNPAPAGCKVAYVQDFAPSDGLLDASGHGTNVSGIVVGVAPGARVLGLDVFNGQFGYDSDIIAAINWTIANRATYNIVAVNMSLGDGGHSTSTCSGSSYDAAFANLRAAGILPVVAAGNSAWVSGTLTNGISGPACAPGAVSVGAVYDANIGSIGYSTCSDTTTAADKITCFSQTGPNLSLLAPGGAITAAGITMFGTSQAAPHVAGAVAVLAQANPASSVTARETALTTSGPPITDTRVSPPVTKRRLDVCAAAAAVGGSCGASAPVATKLGFTAQPSGGTSGSAFATQPTVTIQDAGGATVPGATNSVTLSLIGTPGALTCTGGLTKAAVNGVASFSGCVVSAAGTGYVLHAAASGLTAADTPSFDITAPPPAGKPAAPTFTGPAVTSATAQVNWSDNADNESGYRVLKYASGAWVQQGPDLPAGTTSWTDTGLAPGSYYAYWVQAFNAAGTAQTASYLTVITQGLPVAPKPESASGISTTQARITWADNSDNEAGFKVLRYQGGSWVEVGSTAANVTSLTDSGLAPGLTYAYWVVSFNAAGWTYAPAYISATTFATAPGTAPNYNGASVGATSATVRWVDNGSGGTQEDGFRVLRSGPGGWTQVGPDLAPDTTEYTDAGLAPGTYYAYWVVSFKGGALTYARSYITAITADAIPNAPAFTSATAAGPSSATVSWADRSSDEAGFRVLRYSGGTWNVVGTVGPDVTSFTETGLAAKTTYAYWITSYGTTGAAYGNALISVATP